MTVLVDDLGRTSCGRSSSPCCWRRLTEWAKAGVFDQLHLELLDRLGEQGRLDWSRASVDTVSVRARRWGTGGRKSRRSRPGGSSGHGLG